MYEYIEIIGAREHNLKNVSVRIPKNKLVAITGPSGSGKSTFAFDILQRECQRQYMESMGMVTDGMNNAKVDRIVGLSPSISISQEIANRNPRSTVGTFTEILTYLRLLYAKCGEVRCEEKLQPLTMAHFSFNKAEGLCKSCSGLGEVNEVDSSEIVDEGLSIGDGAVQMWQGVMAQHYEKVLLEASKHYGFEFDVKKPVGDYNELERMIFYDGVDSQEFKALFPGIKKPKRVSDGYFEGILTFLRKKSAENIRKGSFNRNIEACFKRKTCPDCGGSRLNERARNVFLDGKSIVEISDYTIDDLKSWILFLKERLGDADREVSYPIIVDILHRIESVLRIGLGYLNISRTIKSLSGGEAQRLRMANLMDSVLTGVLYILDEPTSGLHPKDTLKILDALKRLRDMGNTIIVIEHDMDFVSKCDYVIDFGPHSGVSGGNVVACGSVEVISDSKTSITGIHMNEGFAVRSKGSMEVENAIRIRNANAHNLKNIDVDVPLERLVAFTGVSGSGKSTLVFDVLAGVFDNKRPQAGYETGMENIERVVRMNQQRIGKSSRSTLATYTDIFTGIRSVFSKQKSARERKLKNSDFSFNVKGGRCEKCHGLGVIPLDMHFLDDIEVLCPACGGKRFNESVLQVKYKGYNISQVLDMTVKQNKELFIEERDIYKRLSLLDEVGLGYVALGQSTSTLSGGESQRIKLSKELGRSSEAKTLYLLDEPTTGLHPSDISKLMKILRKLVECGNSVIVIEHSLEVIAQSDWVIDLGPEGGTKGGRIVAQGTPYDVMMCPESFTGKFLDLKRRD